MKRVFQRTGRPTNERHFRRIRDIFCRTGKTYTMGEPFVIREPRICPSCQLIKELRDDFTQYRSGRKLYRHRWCNRCRAAHSRVRPVIQENIRVLERAKERCCDRCGQEAPNPAKTLVYVSDKGELKPVSSTLVQRRNAFVQTFVSQCKVLCGNCFVTSRRQDFKSLPNYSCLADMSELDQDILGVSVGLNPDCKSAEHDKH